MLNILFYGLPVFIFVFAFFFVYSFSQIVKDYHLLCEAVIEDIIVSLGSSKRNEKNPKFFNLLMKV